LVHADASSHTVRTIYQYLLRFLQDAEGKEDPETRERLKKLRKRTGGYCEAETKLQLKKANEVLKGKGRLAYVIVWRNADANPTEQDRLAVLDQQSINFVLSVAQSFELQTHHQLRSTGKNSDKHDWYYFTGMTPQEECLITQADDEICDDVV